MGSTAKGRIWRNAAANFSNLAHTIKAWAARKIGLSLSGNIYQFHISPDDFKLYTSGKRSVFILNAKLKLEIGDCIRLKEFLRLDETGEAKGMRKEAHFFIKDIVPAGSPGLKAGYYALTLE